MPPSRGQVQGRDGCGCRRLELDRPEDVPGHRREHQQARQDRRSRYAQHRTRLSCGSRVVRVVRRGELLSAYLGPGHDAKNSEQRWPELRLADQVPEPPQGDRGGAHPDEHQDHARAYPHCAASDGPKVRHSAMRRCPGSLEPS